MVVVNFIMVSKQQISGIIYNIKSRYFNFCMLNFIA
jgi:hypothetical protein